LKAGITSTTSGSHAGPVISYTIDIYRRIPPRQSCERTSNWSKTIILTALKSSLAHALNRETLPLKESTAKYILLESVINVDLGGKK